MYAIVSKRGAGILTVAVIGLGVGVVVAPQHVVPSHASGHSQVLHAQLVVSGVFLFIGRVVVVVVPQQVSALDMLMLVGLLVFVGQHPPEHLQSTHWQLPGF